jgi:hypothetical protein
VTKVKAIDYNDNEYIFENPEIVRQFSNKEPIWEKCGKHPIFGFIQCPECKGVNKDKYCGKHFIFNVVQFVGNETFINKMPIKDWRIVDEDIKEKDELPALIDKTIKVKLDLLERLWDKLTDDVFDRQYADGDTCKSEELSKLIEELEGILEENDSKVLRK